MKKTALAAGCAAVLTLGLTGCASTFEGSGSKDAASAAQLALKTDDPWAIETSVDAQAHAAGVLADGVYEGCAPGMDGMVGVKLLVKNNHVTCIETVQEGESQSVGGYEAIRDGVYAAMIDEAQGSNIDTVSGATITTAAVRHAVDDALAKAQAAATSPAASAASAEGEGK